MPIFSTIPNSATTLSVNYRPGQEKRLAASKSEAIFTFGDFTIERDYTLNSLTSTTLQSQFGTFDNLETLNAVNFTNNVTSSFVQHNELNLPKKNPKNYSYFSSFYTNVATAINTIIENFPYAIFSYNNGSINISDYVESYNGITLEKTSTFKIPVSGLVNQGGIIYTSAVTDNNFSLPYDYDKFCIQLTGETNVFTIKNYSLSGTYMYFEVKDWLMGGNSISTYINALYIRPTKERVYDYNKSITALESQLLTSECTFMIPNVDTPQDDSFEQSFLWPRNIDGFAPDSYGTDFETYRDNLLIAAEKIDDEKTNIFIKTIVPENYLELDSNGQIYRTIISTYAYEFDKLKNYIDAIAYAHSVEYNNEETVPQKFMAKLSQLLGWKLADGFSEMDLFDYLTTDVDAQANSFSYFNIEIWRRILVNLVWLYKKKGTRDAIMFIFKLLGAPDCLVNLNEFVYDITQQVNNSQTYPLIGKIDEDGYIRYDASVFAFQEGGAGRGDGHAYINQWTPEFNPIMRIDNIKVQTGDTTYGTRNIVNTKEFSIGFDSSKAIECDVFKYFSASCSCWSWGSSCPPFSSLTVPFEYLTFSCDIVSPVNITAMTLTEYIDYVYTNSIDPTTRKTNSQVHTTWSYPELENIYLAYYYATYPANSHLTIGRLEAYLELLEVQLGSYITQLIPATTIFEDGVATIYKNPIFHRQRFVYKEGIDRGSVFRKKFPDDLNPHLTPSNVNLVYTPRIIAAQQPVLINSEFIDTLIPSLNIIDLGANVITTRIANLGMYSINCYVNENYTNTNIAAVSITNTSISETSEQQIPGNVITN